MALILRGIANFERERRRRTAPLRQPAENFRTSQSIRVDLHYRSGGFFVTARGDRVLKLNPHVAALLNCDGLFAHRVMRSRGRNNTGARNDDPLDTGHGRTVMIKRHGLAMVVSAVFERPAMSVVAFGQSRTSGQSTGPIAVHPVPEKAISPNSHFDCIRFALIASVGY